MGEGTSGGVDTDVGVSGTTGTQDSSYSPPSYSSLGQSPGAMGGRPDPTPAPVVRPSNDYFTPMNDQPMSGQGPVNTFSRYLQSFTDDVSDFFGGGTQTDDRGPSSADVGAVSVNDNQFNRGLASLSGVPDFVRIGGGTSSPTRNTGPFIPDPPTVNVDPTMAALRRGAPALMASNAAEEAVQTAVAQPKFMFDYGFGDAGSPQIDTRDERADASIVGPIRTLDRSNFQNIIFPAGVDRFAPMGQGMGTYTPLADQPDYIQNIPKTVSVRNPSDVAKPAVIDTLARPDANAEAAKLAALARSGSGAKTQEELNILQRLGRFLKGVGKSISNFEMNDIFEFLKGDPNYKGPSPAQQQLMGVPGPGPFVGGGVPSPSGGGGMAAPAKDPCPPGFRFDPTLQQCVPIIAPNTPTDTTTPTATPTTPATGTSPPAAGGIANAYPFTLTPPIGTPVGNLPPVRLTT